MSMKYRIAATTLSRIRSDAAEAIDLDDDELYEYKGYIKVTDAIDKATAKWLENYADEIRRECAGECNWHEVDDGDDTLWSTSCGGEWYFTEGCPRDGGYMYCPRCGKHVKFADSANKEAGK